MIKGKSKYIVYGIYKALFWGFFGKETRRKKGTVYRKFKDVVDRIEKYFDSVAIDSLPDDAREVARHIRGKGLETVFPYDFIHKYFLPASIAISYDNKIGMYYAKRRGKRLYLKQDTYESALNYYWSLIYEQDKRSPHLYFEKNVKGDILFDIGGAEGFFSLDHIEDFKEIYIFEGDSSWFPALDQTFKQVGNIHIVKRYVGSCTQGDVVSIDDFVCENEIDVYKRLFVKMDVEGAELAVLRGATKTLKEAGDISLAVCIYHKQNDERSLSDELMSYRRFKLSYSKGYMIMFYMDDIEEPYLRKGILRAETARGYDVT